MSEEEFEGRSLSYDSEADKGPRKHRRNHRMPVKFPLIGRIDRALWCCSLQGG
jgi:hypothetical protein